MKRHVQVGAKLLADGQSELIRMAEEIALTHHERFDGSGYPNGLRRDEIPLVGQVVAVADVFDTLIHKRPYKEAWPLEAAVAELNKGGGKGFNPKVLSAFFYVLAEEHDTLFEKIEKEL